MTDAAPTVYVLTGEDEYAIAQQVANLQAKLGDASIAEMNTTRLDGATYNPDQLLTVAGAMPFLARRRLVILSNPLAKLANSQPAREKFRKQLEQIPPTTALVLIEYRTLTRPQDRKDPKKVHWLERWAEDHPNFALFKNFPAPKGGELTKRIMKLAEEAGGKIDGQAAGRLAVLVDEDIRLAAQEIDKLLAYVNYTRTITSEDVEAVTADSNEGDVFTLVDQLSARNGREALNELHRLMEYNDYYALFGMIVRQFRLLIQSREILDGGGQKGDIQRVLKQHPFVAEKLAGQSQRFSVAELETAYHRLVEVDQAVKTSRAPDNLALEFFIASFTTAPDQHLI